MLESLNYLQLLQNTASAILALDQSIYALQREHAKMYVWWTCISWAWTITTVTVWNYSLSIISWAPKGGDTYSSPTKMYYFIQPMPKSWGHRLVWHTTTGVWHQNAPDLFESWSHGTICTAMVIVIGTYWCDTFGYNGSNQLMKCHRPPSVAVAGTTDCIFYHKTALSKVMNCTGHSLEEGGWESSHWPQPVSQFSISYHSSAYYCRSAYYCKFFWRFCPSFHNRSWIKCWAVAMLLYSVDMWLVQIWSPSQRPSNV